MHRRTRAVAALVLALLVALLAVGMATAAPKGKVPQAVKDSAKLRRAVEPAGILVHERRFQRIADANGGTRASGTPGYRASVDYVAGKLRNAGYKVSIQNFDFPFFRELAPAELERVSPNPKTYTEADVATMTYSGSGDVTANLQAVDLVLPPPTEPGSTSGCEAADFAGFTPGNVALIQRGTCTFEQKAQNAEAAGASAVIIFNEGQPGRQETLLGTLGNPGINIPVVGTSFAVGDELAQNLQSGPVQVRVATSTESEIRPTSNVIADSRKGRANRTIVVGSHLDSVVEGPGMNDNGSGSATTLEIALQMAKQKIKPENRLRFAFWGAEELGLLGAEQYVSSLSNRQLDQIALNLNFDMLGSRNFVRFVYDGDGSATPDDPTDAGPAGSAQIERVFNRYYRSKNLQTDPTPFDGRSDYGPFIARGIPAGGLFSGAEGIKTARQARIYGGTAGEPYDPCYHQACDDISNLSVKSLDQLSDGAAHATYTFAKSKSLFTGTTRSFSAKSAANVYDEYRGSLLIR